MEGFAINPVTGIITTTKSLDRELQELYTVTGKSLELHSITHCTIILLHTLFRLSKSDLA